MHGSTMMFLFAVPVMEAMAVYLVPLMVGTRNIAFPRLNAFSYWMYLFGGLFLWGAFVAKVGPNVGWFAYVPLSELDYHADQAGRRLGADDYLHRGRGAGGGGGDRRDGVQAARAGHDARPHSALRLVDAGDGLPRHLRHAGDHGRLDRADPRPARQHAVLPIRQRRPRLALAASVLVLRPSRRSTSSSFPRRAWSPRSSRRSRGGRFSAIRRWCCR